MARALKTRVIAFVAIAAALLLALVWWVGDFSLSRRDELLENFQATYHGGDGRMRLTTEELDEQDDQDEDEEEDELEE